MIDIIIIGGGLAGLVSAIHLRKAGHRILLIEKGHFPRNKVCGEYISNEVRPYLESLDIDLSPLKPVNISRFHFSSSSGQIVKTQLGLGAFSVRRYSLDYYLFDMASALDVEVLQKTTVADIRFAEDQFTVESKEGQQWQSRVVIGSYGKRSVLDRTLRRPFFQRKVDYVGVKNYFEAPEFPEDLVELQNFPGGYCGLSKVENDWVNVAYLTKAAPMKEAGSVEAFEEKTLGQNPNLRAFFNSHRRMLPKSLVISNVSFVPKELITDHVLMTGDAAGMIPPLAGNGMAMAIHSAKLVSEEVSAFLNGKITRMDMEDRYRKAWNLQFRSRLFWGRQVQKYMGSRAMELGVRALKVFPFMLPVIVNQTHGKPIKG